MNRHFLSSREAAVRQGERPARGLRGLLRAMGNRLAEASELAGMDDRGLADIGVTRAEAQALTRLGNRSASLLNGMKARLGVSDAMLQAEPELRRDIQRTCVTCDAQRTCRHWLRDPGSVDGYRRFCPNAGAFELVKKRRDVAAWPHPSAADARPPPGGSAPPITPTAAPG